MYNTNMKSSNEIIFEDYDVWVEMFQLNRNMLCHIIINICDYLSIKYSFPG